VPTILFFTIQFPPKEALPFSGPLIADDCLFQTGGRPNLSHRKSYFVGPNPLMKKENILGLPDYSSLPKRPVQ
jgi:hypothetical protein